MKQRFVPFKFYGIRIRENGRRVRSANLTPWSGEREAHEVLDPESVIRNKLINIYHLS